MLVAGFFTIYKITKSLTYLSSEMKEITQDNLHKRVKHIHSSDEIGELAHNFNSLLDRINDAFKREKQFIGDVAHELRTPLATLRSSIEVTLKKQRSNDEYIRSLKTVLEETKQLSSTVNDVLDLAWTESPDAKKQMSEFNLSELIEELFEICEKMAAEKKLILEQNIEKKITINGYREKMARAILNIMVNAIKYTDKGTVCIDLKRDGEKVSITITDTGIGISQKDALHIFDRFYRGTNSGKSSGSGLGLAIAKSVITLHKGSIEFEKINKGSLFRIILPAISSS